MKGLGVFFIGVAVFGWFGFFFAGSGYAALIAIGFLIAGVALTNSTNTGKSIDNIDYIHGLSLQTETGRVVNETSMLKTMHTDTLRSVGSAIVQDAQDNYNTIKTIASSMTKHTPEEGKRPFKEILAEKKAKEAAEAEANQEA